MLNAQAAAFLAHVPETAEPVTSYEIRACPAVPDMNLYPPVTKEGKFYDKFEKKGRRK
jgi:hypothetical protein